MKMRLGVFLLVLSMFMSACSEEKVDKENENTMKSSLVNTEKVKMYKMESYAETNEESVVVIEDDKVISTIKQAFDSAKREPGIVDMADPHYKVESDEETFFLWISEENQYGTIMNVKDTHTIYSLSEDYTKQINNVIKSHFK